MKKYLFTRANGIFTSLSLRSTDQQINRSTDQQINRSTDQQINRSTDQQINRFFLLLALFLAGGVVGIKASPFCSIQPTCDPNYYIYDPVGAGVDITSTNIPVNAVNLVICVENSSLVVNRNQTFTNCTFIFKSSGYLFLNDRFNTSGSRICIFNNCCLMGDQGIDWRGILADGEWKVDMTDSYITNAQIAFKLQRSVSGFNGYLSMSIHGSKFINNNICLDITNNGGAIDIFNSEFINIAAKYSNIPTTAMIFRNSNVYINESQIQNFENGIRLSNYRSNLNISKSTVSFIRKNALNGDIPRCYMSVYNSLFKQIGLTAIKNGGPIDAVDNKIEDADVGISLSLSQPWPVSFYLIKNKILARITGISLSNCRNILTNGLSIVSENNISMYPNAVEGIGIENCNMPGGIYIGYDTIFTHGSGINIKMTHSVYIEQNPIFVFASASNNKSGILISDNSSNCFLLNNKIFSLSPNIACIDISYSTENQLCCNQSTYGRYAFRVSGPSKMNWRSSEFIGLRPAGLYPVLLDAVASIGIQLHPGNHWLYPLSQTAFEAINENPDFILSRIFPDDIPIENPRTSPAGWFIPENTPSFHCQTPACELIWSPSRKRPGLQKELDHFVIDSILTGPFAAQQKDWYIRQLYERYFEDSLDVMQDEYLHTYVLNHQSDDLYVMAYYYNQIDNIIYQSQALSNLKSSMQRSKFIIDSLSALRQNAELSIFQIFNPQAIDIINHSNATVDSLTQLYVSISSALFIGLKNQLSDFFPGHYWAQQDKIFINHYIDIWVNDFQSLDSNQYQDLSTLATQCPLISGDVCFKAAGTLRLLGYDAEVNTNYNCLVPEENNHLDYRSFDLITKRNNSILPEDDTLVSVYDINGKYLMRCHRNELKNKLCGLAPTHTLLVIMDQFNQKSKMLMPPCSGQ